MGGLVARAALLTKNLPMVKRVFLIGTPNFGSFTTANFALLSSMAFAATRVVYGVFRRPGLTNLTRISKVFDGVIKTGAQYTKGIEYITIPGTFFNKNRSAWELGTSSIWRGAFGGIDIGLQLLSAPSALWRITMEKPHDGIVEEQSNRLVPSGSARYSEKSDVLARNGIKEYGHFVPKISDDLIHVEIQHNPEIIDLVKEIALSKGAEDWFDMNSSNVSILSASFRNSR